MTTSTQPAINHPVFAAMFQMHLWAKEKSFDCATDMESRLGRMRAKIFPGREGTSLAELVEPIVEITTRFAEHLSPKETAPYKLEEMRQHIVTIRDWAVQENIRPVRLRRLNHLLEKVIPVMPQPAKTPISPAQRKSGQGEFDLGM